MEMFPCLKGSRRVSYLVDKAHKEPMATAYVAPSQPTYLNATGSGLFLSSM